MPEDANFEHPSKKATDNPCQKQRANPVLLENDSPVQGGNSGVSSAKASSGAEPKASHGTHSNTSDNKSATLSPLIILPTETTEGQADSGQVGEVEIVSQEEGDEDGKEVQIQNKAYKN